jgi:tetratricopeptide (TPR) repeat protein
MKYTILAVVLALVVCGCTNNKSAPVMSANPAPGSVQAEPRPEAPLTANTHFAAGQLAEAQDDLPRATEQYLAALQIDPKFAPALLHLGMVYTTEQKFDDALAIWHRYVDATGQSAAAYCDLGFTLELAQRPAEAEKAYLTAVTREPKNETVRVNYGLMLARQGKIDRALQQLQEVLTPAEAHYNIASIMEGQSKIDDAKTQYREALRLDPDMSDAKARLTGLDSSTVEP